MLAQKQPSIKRVRNSSLVECPRAEDVTGLNCIPKLGMHFMHGRRALCAGGSQSGSAGGLHTSENAGTSSESGVRISAVDCPRFPGEGSSSQGKSGPKLRANAVGDG